MNHLPKVYFYATGGLVNSLKLLERTLIYAHGLPVLPYFAHKLSLGHARFSTLFNVDNSVSLRRGVAMLEKVPLELEQEIRVWATSRGKFHSATPGHSNRQLQSLRCALPVFLRREVHTAGAGAKPPTHQFRTILSAISLKNEVVTKVNRMAPNPDLDYIAVHYRNTDFESNFEATIRQVRITQERLGIEKIYWASDDALSVQAAEKELGNSLMPHLKLPRRVPGSRNLHTGVRREDAWANLIRALVDLYALRHARHFIASVGSPTSWTGFITEMRSGRGDLFSRGSIGELDN